MNRLVNRVLTAGVLVVSLWLVAFHQPVRELTPAKRKLMADRSKSTLTYAMSHPMHRWEGVSHDVACAMVIDDANKVESVAAAAKVSTFDSGNSNRDSHGLEAMESLKFPKVTFASTDVQQEGNNLTVKGNLTFHGVTKPVVLQAVRQDDNGQISIKGNFDIRLSDYKVEKPSLMMVPVDEDVKLSFLMVFPKGAKGEEL